MHLVVRRKVCEVLEVGEVGDFYIPIDPRSEAMLTTCWTSHVLLRQSLRPD